MAGTSMGVGSLYVTGQIVRGDYRIMGKLGQGGMGAVYEVEHVKTGNTYALKTLFSQYMDQPGYKERFEREAGIMAHLTHPNIVQIVDYNVDGVPFLVMERLYGTDLTHRIQEAGFLTFGQSLEILTPVVDALELAHNMPQPIVHRDLKPDNIFLCDDGIVKLLDFGIAKKLRDEGEQATVHTMDGSTMGTMNFMSPEQARGEVRQIDQRTDIFALGAILYQMLSGRYAFDGHGMAVLSKIFYENPPPLAQFVGSVPAGVQQVIDTALAKDKWNRYTTVTEFLDDLQRIDQGERPVPRSGKLQPASADPRTRSYGDRTAATLDYSRSEYAQSAPGTNSASFTQGTLDESSAFDYVSSVHLPPMRRKSHAGLFLILGVLAVGGGATASYYTNKPPQFRRFVDKAVHKLRGKKIRLKPVLPPEPTKAKPKKRSRKSTHRRYKKRSYHRRGSRRR